MPKVICIDGNKNFPHGRVNPPHTIPPLFKYICLSPQRTAADVSLLLITAANKADGFICQSGWLLTEAVSCFMKLAVKD